MARYRIVKTIMAKHPKAEIFRDIVDATRPAYLVEKRTCFVWTYVDWWPTQDMAEEHVLRLKGEHPEQIAVKKLLEQKDVVVREYD